VQPLVDADILVYEVAFASVTANEGKIPPFDYAAEMFDMRLQNICAMVDATEPPLLFLTGKGNFRYDIAKTTPYKVRDQEKPFHYHNLKAYAIGKHGAIVTVGMEADDALSLEQTKRPRDTIICTRDKDLRAVAGWHYGWEMGNQPSFGPKRVDSFGSLALSSDRRTIKGEGILFFYAQTLMGDKTDNIPGLKGCGAVQAFKTLDGCTTTMEAFKAVQGAYRGLHGDVEGDRMLLEQGRLVHMTRYLDEWGNVILWEFPDVC
jgi:hypothetical protein